jgi:hypothetical protein
VAPGSIRCLLVALAVALVIGDGGVAVAAPFCDGTVARDYEAPFRRMPPERPPPEGELPFGPRNMSMFRVDWRSIALRGGNLGYRFGAKDAGVRTLRLNWDVTARLIAVDAAGRPRREVGRERERFASVGGYDERGYDLPEFVFPAERVGLYRLDLSFRNLHGRALGRYREYFRVVPRTVKMDLRLSAAEFHPGETAYARVADLGTNGMNVPFRYSVERLEGTAWVSAGVTVTPGDALSPEEGWWMQGGEAAPCTEYAIPLDAEAGRYRMSTSVQPFGSRRHRLLTAGFSVGP